MQFLIGDHALVAGFAFENDSRFILAICFQMAIHAVIADVGLSTNKPFGKRSFTPIQDFVEFLEPVQFRFGKISPKLFRIVQCLLIEGAVPFHTFDVSLGDKLRAWQIDSFLTHSGLILSRCVEWRVWKLTKYFKIWQEPTNCHPAA